MALSLFVYFLIGSCRFFNLRELSDLQFKRIYSRKSKDCIINSTENVWRRFSVIMSWSKDYTCLVKKWILTFHVESTLQSIILQPHTLHFNAVLKNAALLKGILSPRAILTYIMYFDPFIMENTFSLQGLMSSDISLISFGWSSTFFLAS